MKLEDLVSIDQLVDFLSGTQAVAFSVLSDQDVCYQVLAIFPFVILGFHADNGSENINKKVQPWL